jgi:quercetin dioxygenase-like cupin family protein
MDIQRVGSQASTKGPEEYFTGVVRIDPLFDRSDPARVAGAQVTFEPRARTAWHTHPLGQTLIVTSGLGRVQRWGGTIEEMRPGDVVLVASHIAIQEKLDGKNVEWLEKVSDEQYGG